MAHHLHLFGLHGNWGTVDGDPPADAEYTEVRLSATGWLALGSERQEIGPVPVGIVNGTIYQGGRVPSLAPAGTVGLLQRRVQGELEGIHDLISFPTRGTVEGDLERLYGGHRTRMLLGSRIEREHIDGSTQLLITGIPPGVPVDEVAQQIDSRIRIARHRTRPEEPGRTPVPDGVPGALEVRNEGDRDQPIRVVVGLTGDADVDAAEAGLRNIWPVSIEADLEFPGGLAAMLRDWAHRCAQDRSGPDELTRLL